MQQGSYNHVQSVMNRESIWNLNRKVIRKTHLTSQIHNGPTLAGSSIHQSSVVAVAFFPPSPFHFKLKISQTWPLILSLMYNFLLFSPPFPFYSHFILNFASVWHFIFITRLFTCYFSCHFRKDAEQFHASASCSVIIVLSCYFLCVTCS